MPPAPRNSAAALQCLVQGYLAYEKTACTSFFFLFFFVTLGLELSDTKVYDP